MKAHVGPRPLTGFEPDLVDQLVRATREIGADVRLNTSVRGIEKSSNRMLVHTSTDSLDQAFEADLVVHGAGRVPEMYML